MATATQTPEEVIASPTVQSILQRQAEKLAGQPGFSRADAEDFKQVFAIELLAKLKHYDPEKAALTTFVNKVIANKAVSMQRHAYRKRRDCRRNTASVETVAHTLEQPDPTGALQLKLDLEAFIDDLPPGLDVACRQVLDDPDSVAQLPAKTLFELRRRLKLAGLDAYLVR